MGRPSNREARRAEILGAFARVLADHGYAGATIAAVATEAEVAPGLIHYHFADKEDLLVSLLRDLVGRFRVRVREREDEPDPLLAFIIGALVLGAFAPKKTAGFAAPQLHQLVEAMRGQEQ
jgi:TetR/AcrR family transcriptional repressor of bet genes